VPTTLLGLLLFVALLAPGLAHTVRAQVNRPVVKPSPLREAARLALISLLSDLVALALFGAFRAWQPDRTPDAGRLVREPGPYFEAHYAYLIAWGTGLLALACAVALAGAALQTSRPARWLKTAPGLRWALAAEGGAAQEPAWWRLFAARPERIHVGCQLADGTWISGELSSFSAESDETENRELVLAGDLSIRAAEDDDPVPYPASAIVVSARRIQYLAVTYITADPPAAPDPAAPDPAGPDPYRAAAI
jgi:hypothetical protein